jgi:hypothetical protein
MAAPGEGSEIIIKGGSVELDYDEADFPKDNSDPKKHKNPTKKITRVVITGDIKFDSGEQPGGLKCEIRTTCK